MQLRHTVGLNACAPNTEQGSRLVDAVAWVAGRLFTAAPVATAFGADALTGGDATLGETTADLEDRVGSTMGLEVTGVCLVASCSNARACALEADAEVEEEEVEVVEAAEDGTVSAEAG